MGLNTENESCHANQKVIIASRQAGRFAGAELVIVILNLGHAHGNGGRRWLMFDHADLGAAHASHFSAGVDEAGRFHPVSDL